MICQSCLQSNSKTDEVDMYKEFTGHEVCYAKNRLIENQDEYIRAEEYETEIQKLSERITELEKVEEELVIAKEALQQPDGEQRIRRLDKEFKD